MLGRFRTPEIVLGALFGTALMAGIWGWTDSYSPSERQKQECYESAKKSGYKGDECKSFWEKVTSDPVAFFTLVLAFSTVGLWAATFLLYRAGEKQIAVANKAADAANLSAKAAIALQSPIIRVRPDGLGHGVTAQGERTIEHCDVHAITIFNLGATKAFPKEALYGWTVGDALPEKCSYSFSERFPINCILKADADSVLLRLNGDHILKEGEWSTICRGNYLWFYCSLIYEDFMEERHTHGFCWRWSSTGFGVDWRADNTPAYNGKT